MGWIRCRPSDTAWATPTTSTRVRGGSTNMAGTRIASNRSSAPAWSRYWKWRVGNPAAVSRTRNASAVGQDGSGAHNERSASRPPTAPIGARGAGARSTGAGVRDAGGEGWAGGSGGGGAGGGALLPRCFAAPGLAHASPQAPYHADPGRGEP